MPLPYFVITPLTFFFLVSLITIKTKTPDAKDIHATN